MISSIPCTSHAGESYSPQEAPAPPQKHTPPAQPQDTVQLSGAASSSDGSADSH